MVLEASLPSVREDLAEITPPTASKLKGIEVRSYTLFGSTRDLGGMGYLSDFNAALERRDHRGMQQLWEEYCAGEEVDGLELKSILEAIARSELADQFGQQAETILPLWEKISEPRLADDVLRLLFDLETSDSAELAQLAFQYLEERYGQQPHFQQKLRLVGLRGTRDSFRGAIRNFELLNHLDKGRFVYHTGGWGTGEVRDLSLLREQVLIEFDLVPGRKEMTFASAFKHLIPLSAEHFLARRFGDPDTLEQEAKEDPVGVIRLLLQDLGPKTAAELKEELCELVIPESDWSRWWQNARAKLKKDSLVETPSEPRGPFRLRDQEHSHEAEMFALLQNKADLTTLIQLIFSFIRDFPSLARGEEFKDTVSQRLVELLQHEELPPEERLQLLFLLEEVGVPCHERLQELIAELSDPVLVTYRIPQQTFKKRLLSLLREHCEGWPPLFCEVMTGPIQAPLRDFLLEELKEAEQEPLLEKVFHQLLCHPEQHPEGFVWLFSRIVSSSKRPLPMQTPSGRAKALEALLTLFAHLERVGGDRDLLKKIHHILTAHRFKVVRQIMDESSEAQVREFLLLATKSPTLNAGDSRIFLSLAEVAHPGLAQAQPATVELDQQYIWTTPEGLRKLKQRLEHLATVETVENTREIESARALGDLRENSEFKFALERQRHIQQEMKSLSDQLQLARVFPMEEVRTEVAGFGTTVELADEHGQLSCYTLLGPWDADPEAGVLSYQSKAAQALLGRPVGDEVELNGRILQITDIRSA